MNFLIKKEACQNNTLPWVPEFSSEYQIDENVEDAYDDPPGKIDKSDTQQANESVEHQGFNAFPQATKEFLHGFYPLTYLDKYIITYREKLSNNHKS